jgi:acetoin utilization deacetylase AcuC-like enzyme
MDRLGGLSVTKEGLKKRDIMVRDFMPDKPIVIVLAGGYAMNTEDTVNLHVQTAEVMAELY